MSTAHFSLEPTDAAGRAGLPVVSIFHLDAGNFAFPLQLVSRITRECHCVAWLAPFPIAAAIHRHPRIPAGCCHWTCQQAGDRDDFIQSQFVCTCLKICHGRARPTYVTVRTSFTGGTTTMCLCKMELTKGLCKVKTVIYTGGNKIMHGKLSQQIKNNSSNFSQTKNNLTNKQITLRS